MSESGAAEYVREEYDQSLLRLYDPLGKADTYRDVMDALTPEMKRMLGFNSVWLHLLREEEHDLLLLDRSGTVADSTDALEQDGRFRVMVHGEPFVVLQLEGDLWLKEILDYGDVHVTEDARTHPLTNKDIVAITGSRTVVGVPLVMAEKTFGVLCLGTFFDEGVHVPEPGQIDYLRRLATYVAVALDRVRFLGVRREAEEALQQTVQQLRFASFVLDNVIDGVIVRSIDDGRVLYVNHAMCELTGLSREALLASTDYSWVCAADADALSRHVAAVRANGEGELEVMTSGSRPVPVETRSQVVEYIGRQATLTLVSDISERKAAQAAIEYMALHDPLTDLANRALFNDRLALAMAHSRRSREPLALMLLDIDHFKAVNDSAGHVTGDLVLQEVAKRLRSAVRIDDTVARFGGDEFTLVLPDCGGPEAASAIAEKVLASLREPLREDGICLTPSASLGVALYECDDVSLSDMLRNADLAMYCAKEAGRDCFRLYEPAMNTRAAERFALKLDLEQAIAREELELHYQPIVSLEDGSILCAEALCRWTHPERGPVPPATFIPLAEESSAINELGEWVLREACTQAAGWQAHGRSVRVSVNLSPRQLTECDLASVVRGALAGARLDPSLLQLEITESMAVRDAPYLTNAFSELRELGVRIAIDDFGTGYASLDYLTRFPVDVLKVDRTFVRGVTDHVGCRAVASAVVSMATALGIEAVAEGVETEEQRRTLLEVSCAQGQGYLFSPGVPAVDFRRLLGR